MKTNTTLVILAIMASLGLVTVVAVDIMLAAQEAEARESRTSIAFNASQGRCFRGDVQSTDEATIEDKVEGEEDEGEDDQDEEEDDK
jgi:hypothetical protein